ncbi:SGNH/GDSL hydrolase family protein [Hymenobacter sp. J193]|uniref:SGNH/GDSL hydrolase family protein n=1 Tax=Hymenobacter sp. J193 TaxID=2898429 RepID=UPI0021515BC6|nr:SGNH/GDSL hydrolase family protein [Hymenobacter sp. J193]MCR5887858.1 SGNH/GDSL hydrolase family protein [Hymenobacter sp. J193]
MRTFFKNTLPALALLGLVLGGCQPELDAPKADGGSADFSKYLAVGNSLTAGFGDNGLYLEGQQNSYPAILAQQFQKAGGGEFKQPLFAANEANGSGYLKITGFSNGSPTIGAETANTAMTRGTGLDGKTMPLTLYTGTDNQNLGVPGIRVADITTNGYGLNNPLGFNPYFERLLPAGDLRSYVQYVQERVGTVKPTFFTNWLGNNDVLGFASSGGTAAPLTPVEDFTTKYNQMVDVLTANNAKGLVATIPNVTTVPLFTTVPTAAVIAQVNATPIPAALVPTVVAALGLPAGSALPTGTRFGLYIRTSSATAPVREATANDLLLLPARSVINTPSATSPFPNGIGLVIPGAPAPVAAALAGFANPLPNNLVLDSGEATAVATRTAELNTVIKAAAERKGLAVFDANAFFNTVARTGIVTNGVNNTTSFVTGNLFSLDGVHPTPRGYAIVANEMIKVINSKYGSSIPQVDPNAYRGVKLP